MRISLTGAHGTGKTTLIQHPYWREKFPNYKIQDTIARHYPKNWSGKKIQRKVNFKYLLTHLISKNLISTRSFYDPWAYSRCTIDKDFMIWYFSIGVKLIHYDYLFYLPIEFELIDDNFRPLDIKYQKIIDQEILNLLKTYNIRYYTITGTIEERISSIDKYIHA